MTTYGGSKGTFVDKLMVVLAVGAGLLLFVALSQPAWRGEEMAAEFKADCAKRGGVLLEHKKMFGTSYECASRLGGQP